MNGQEARSSSLGQKQSAQDTDEEGEKIKDKKRKMMNQRKKRSKKLYEHCRINMENNSPLCNTVYGQRCTLEAISQVLMKPVPIQCFSELVELQ